MHDIEARVCVMVTILKTLCQVALIWALFLNCLAYLFFHNLNIISGLKVCTEFYMKCTVYLKCEFDEANPRVL